MLFMIVEVEGRDVIKRGIYVINGVRSQYRYVKTLVD
jgi:hypothetical protein